MQTRHPGLYYQEGVFGAATSGNSPAEGAIVGMFEKGDIHKSNKVSSSAEGARLYGGNIFNQPNPHARLGLDAFFANGGGTLNVARVVGAGAASAFRNLPSVVDSSDNSLRVQAGNPGAWGNRLVAHPIKKATTTTTQINPATVIYDMASTEGFETGDVIYFKDDTTRYAWGILKAKSSTQFFFGAGLLYTDGLGVFTSTSASTCSSHRCHTKLARNITGGATTEFYVRSTGGIKVGSILLYVPGLALANIEVKVTDIEESTGRITFDSTVFPAVLASSAHLIVSMEFDLAIYERGIKVGDHRFLSMESNSPDYIETRLGSVVGFTPLAPADDSDSKIIVAVDLAPDGFVDTSPLAPFTLPAGTLPVPFTYDLDDGALIREINLQGNDGTGAIPITPVTFTFAPAIKHSVGAGTWDTTGWGAAADLVYNITDSTGTHQYTYAVPIGLGGVAGLVPEMADVLADVNAHITGFTFQPDGAGGLNCMAVTDERGDSVSFEIDASTDAAVFALFGGFAAGAVTGTGTSAFGNVAFQSAVTLTEIRDAIVAATTDITLTPITGTSLPALVLVDGAVGAAMNIMATAATTVGATTITEFGLTLAVPYTGTTGAASVGWAKHPAPAPLRLTAGANGAEPGPTTGAETYIGSNVTPKTGLYLFEDQKYIKYVTIPGAWGAAEATPTIMQYAIEWCENTYQKALFICTVPPSKTTAQDMWDWRNEKLNRDSSFGALYAPYVKVPHPEISGYLYTTDPSCAIMGIHAQVAGTTGPHTAPANMALSGVSDVLVRLTDSDQDLLNPSGINAIRLIPAKGIRVYGARTLWSQEDGRHLVTVRNMINDIKVQAEDKLQILLYKPMNPANFIQGQLLVQNIMDWYWDQGAFPVASKGQAYSVQFDTGTTPPSEQANNRGNIVIKMINPARFFEFLTLSVELGYGAVTIAEL